MRFFVIGTRGEVLDELTPEFLQYELKCAAKLWKDDFIREIYNRTDGKGGVFVVEAESEEEVLEKLGTLPMVQEGILTLEVYGAKVWRAIEAIADG